MQSILAFDPDSITPRDLSMVLDNARALLLCDAAGERRTLLRGRQLGLLCESDAEGDAASIRQAAVDMGAQVAYIRPGLMALGTPLEIQRTARMLGRLYDAVACEGLASALVRQLAADAGVPVYDGLASARHSTAKLVDLLGGEASAADKRRAILQAVLLGSIA